MTTTGHSVTESSTRVRKDADGGQQDSSGVVHDFMEPTLAIPAHLKIDVSLSLSLSHYTHSSTQPPNAVSYYINRSPIIWRIYMIISRNLLMYTRPGAVSIRQRAGCHSCGAFFPVQFLFLF